jgi:hypothetical protein
MKVWGILYEESAEGARKPRTWEAEVGFSFFDDLGGKSVLLTTVPIPSVVSRTWGMRCIRASIRRISKF